jgi:YegS/Rv2252/BmrU family lipid kinase
MRKAALLYNPNSGGSKRRLRELESALAILRRGGVEADLVPTESRAQGGEQARQAIASGCDTIFACGGDGTIHNVVQVLANTPVALAVLPMGTANALAHDLDLPSDIAGAAEAALTGVPRRIPLGRVEYRDLKANPGSRYFVVTAGVGVDAQMIYKLQSGTKQWMGMAAYYARAWNLWFSYPMTRFRAQYRETGSESERSANVTELMSVRIRNFGGVVRELAPGASLDREDMRLVFCRTASRLAYLAYVTRGLLGLRWKIPGIDLVDAARVSCHHLSPEAGRKIYVEADGELLGTLPAVMTVVPNALTLLAPR